jgi:hypothetical protein
MNKHIINKLKYLGNGIHYCGSGEGWISVDLANPILTPFGYKLLWCDGEHSHSFLGHSACSANVNEKEWSYVCESVRSMWLVHDEDKIQYYIEFMTNKINGAYEWKLTDTKDRRERKLFYGKLYKWWLNKKQLIA